MCSLLQNCNTLRILIYIVIPWNQQGSNNETSVMLQLSLVMTFCYTNQFIKTVWWVYWCFTALERTPTCFSSDSWFPCPCCWLLGLEASGETLGLISALPTIDANRNRTFYEIPHVVKKTIFVKSQKILTVIRLWFAHFHHKTGSDRKQYSNIEFMNTVLVDKSREGTLY